MSIYVELFNKVEEINPENRKPSSREPSATMEASPSDYDFLFEDERISAELPNIDDCWDEILAGKQLSRVKDGQGQHQSIQKPPGEARESESTPDSETSRESTQKNRLAVQEREVSRQPVRAEYRAEYTVRDYGTNVSGDRLVRGRIGVNGDDLDAAVVEERPSPAAFEEVERPEMKGVFEIPLAKFRKAGMVTPDMEHKGIVEEYRHLKRMLLRNIAKSEGKMGSGVAITSAVPGEGKSFTALNLAMSFSLEKNRSVLLVDADIEKGGATRFLGLEGRKGLRDYLENPDLTIDDLIVETSESNIAVLPIGRGHSPVAELFSSDRMEEFVSRITSSDKFQMVIFDCPPVLVSAAANTVAGYADQTLVVVQANQTSAHMIHEVEEALVDSKKIGFLLNRVSPSEKKHNIYYYAEND